jgi:hypothetical protein
MNNKILTDNFSISDKPFVKGVVVMKDENGRIIFKKNNLVVKSGRKLLFDLFKECVTSATERTSKRIGVIYGSGTSAVSSTDTKLGNVINTVPLEAKIESNDSEENYCDIDFDTEGKLYVKFTINISGNSGLATNMSELGLCFIKEEEGVKKSDGLFSRIVFDPLPLTSNNKYTLEYYLYF